MRAEAEVEAEVFLPGMDRGRMEACLFWELSGSFPVLEALSASEQTTASPALGSVEGG